MLAVTSSFSLRTIGTACLLLVIVCGIGLNTFAESLGSDSPALPSYGPKRPFGAPINTRWNQAEMSFAADGTMVFCSDRADKALAPNDVNDLYISTLDPLTGKYSEPTNMGPLVNSVPDTTGATPCDGDDREPWITHDGRSIYFKSTRLARFAADAPLSAHVNNATGEVSHGIETNIFVTHKVDGTWQLPVRLPYPVNTKDGREHCPALLRDGKTLCFASKRPGGFGGSDIWCSVRLADGGYAEPVNAGPDVNSAYDEFHFLEDASSTWVYFTSFRPGGYGSGDIWATRPDGRGGYRSAVNLGASVNRAGNVNICPGFMPNGSLTSINWEEDGTHDIYVNDPVPAAAL